MADSGLLDVQLQVVDGIPQLRLGLAQLLFQSLDVYIANGCRSWSSSRALADIAEGDDPEPCFVAFADRLDDQADRAVVAVDS